MTEAQEIAAVLQRQYDLDLLAQRAYAVAGEGEARLREAARVFGANSGAWRGELLAIVRYEWGDPLAHAQPWDEAAESWAVHAGGSMWARATETEALVAALEST